MELENLVESLQRFAPGVRSRAVPDMAEYGRVDDVVPMLVPVVLCEESQVGSYT